MQSEVAKNSNTMPAQPLVSVCCVTYNHSLYVERAIQSLWNQDYPNIEILVIDDGSTDNNFQLLQQLQAKSKFPMQVFTQKNTGMIGQNLNFTLSKARGELTMFLSLDDEFLPNVVSGLVAQICAEPDCALIFSCRHLFVDSNSNEIRTDLLFPINSSVQHLIEMERSGGSFWLCGSIYRQEVITAVGGFDNDLIGDDIVLRTKLLQYLQRNPTWKCKILDYPLLKYRIHQTNVSSRSVRQLQIMHEVVERYFDGIPSPVMADWVMYAFGWSLRNRQFKLAAELVFTSPMNKFKVRIFFRAILYLIFTAPRKILSRTKAMMLRALGHRA